MQFLIQQFLGQTFFLIFPVHLAKFDNVPDVMFFLMYIYILVYVQLQKLAKGQVAIFRWGFYCVRNHLCLRMLSVVIIFLNYFFWRKTEIMKKSKKKFGTKKCKWKCSGPAEPGALLHSVHQKNCSKIFFSIKYAQEVHTQRIAWRLLKEFLKKKIFFEEKIRTNFTWWDVPTAPFCDMEKKRLKKYNDFFCFDFF